MAENREGLRSDGTLTRVEQLQPHPNNEAIKDIISTSEDHGIGPTAAASEQTTSNGTGEQKLPGDASTVESNTRLDGNKDSTIEPDFVVAQAPRLSADGAAVSGGLPTGESADAAPAETIRPQAGRGAQPPAATHHGTGYQVRRVLAGVLLVLSCLGMLSSALIYWANQTLLNTNQWIQVVGPVAQDPEVVNALSAYAADQSVEVLNVQQRVQNALPDRATFLAIPITQQVHDFVQTKVAQGMNTPAFQRAWITINTSLHKQLVAALRGESQYATISNDTLTLDLVPLIGQALHQIQEQGPGIIEQRVTLPDLSQEQSPEQARQELSQALGVTIPADFGQVVVVQSDQLSTAQQAVRILDILVIALPLITLALLVATIWLSVNRRRTLIELGIGIVIVFVATRILIAYFQQSAIDATRTSVGHAIAQSVIPAALDSLVTITTWLFVIGIVLALVAYLVGHRQRQWLSTAYTQVRADAERLGREIRQ